MTPQDHAHNMFNVIKDLRGRAATNCDGEVALALAAQCAKEGRERYPEGHAYLETLAWVDEFNSPPQLSRGAWRVIHAWNDGRAKAAADEEQVRSLIGEVKDLFRRVPLPPNDTNLTSI